MSFAARATIVNESHICKAHSLLLYGSWPWYYAIWKQIPVSVKNSEMQFPSDEWSGVADAG